MVKKKKTIQKRTIRKKQSISKKKLLMSKESKMIFGCFLFFLGLSLFFSFVSFFYEWKVDQSEVSQWFRRSTTTNNLLSKFGILVSNFFIYQGFGIASFSIAFLTSLSGIYYIFNLRKKKLLGFWFWGLLVMIWSSIVMAFIPKGSGIFAGIIGFEINDFLRDYIGLTGTILFLTFFAIIYIVIRLKCTPEKILSFLKRIRNNIITEYRSNTDDTINDDFDENDDNINSKSVPPNQEKPISSVSKPKDISFQVDIANTNDDSLDLSLNSKENIPKVSDQLELKVTAPVKDAQQDNISKTPEGIVMEVEANTEEDIVDTLSTQLVDDFGEFDPRLELNHYKFPGIDLLKDYTSGHRGITIDQGELEEKKNSIVDTLKNYKIDIAQIKATVGPTVTLYEIVPEAGVRISKIKNLEDDIALSLAALGIRIIAPIPGKGTIGIEVPNKKATIVSMRSAIASPKFQNAEMELPISLGKTIANDTFVVDLAKMPHLLMAGATGQGKSVGLNAILTSLLYKKHPAEVKFVLVDPKKVELTLYNKIERHFLAKLPDNEEAIITDNTKVIHTVNSLCIEMDARYDLLKLALVRNIKEYNAKFKVRKLNPENGHRFLPYIILVIDEFADLIMTAGKEIETPVARLAQLARAVGIHLIIATQRPSVNVITGMIKANFPARIAFRVTSKIDSRTILDSGGADQLIGRGDMLYTQGNDLVRIQCAFVDTPEVEKITDFIGSQRAYADAHLLPEYVGEENGTSIDIDISDRDKLFNEAAEVIVNAQQGSASLLQRKLKLGYNRAGRIIDQLEAAGIVGPFEGSKARQVLVPDILALHKLLEELK